MKRFTLPTVTDCTDCGACCMEMRSPPFTGLYLNEAHDGFIPADDEDHYGDFNRIMAAPAEARQAYLAGLLDDRPNESPCSWLDLETKRCRWYGHRPDVCRNSLQVGDAGCIAWRQKVGIGKRYVMRRGRMVLA